MKKLAHPNICRLHEVIDDPKADKLYLVMDFIEKGAIGSKSYWSNESKYNKRKIIDKSKISTDRLKKYIADCIKGLYYLHTHAKIVHRDIKPDNLLIDEQDNLKIADFGISKIVEEDDKLESEVGTKYFLAPEVWNKDNFRGFPIDVWAVGVTFY